MINLHPEAAYGAGISALVAERTGEDFADAQIYVALRRLEDQAFVNSWTESVSEPSKGSRGRPRKYYRLTAKGQKALKDAGSYISSNLPFRQSTKRGEREGKKKGPISTPVVV